VTSPEEYSFGDAVRQVDWRIQRQALDQLEARFGARTIRLHARNLRSDLAPEAVIGHYERAMVGERGWKLLRLAPPWPAGTAWSVAFVSLDGRAVVAVTALHARHAAGGAVPLTILTNLGRTDGRR
jgi:hypothetical protein